MQVKMYRRFVPLLYYHDITFTESDHLHVPYEALHKIVTPYLSTLLCTYKNLLLM